MGKLNNSENGFSAVEALLILVIVGIVGFVGWYVWHARSGTNNSASTNTVSSASKSQAKSDSSNAKATTQTADLTANWLKYTSQNNKYIMALPDGWHLESIKGQDDIEAWDAKDVPFTEGTPAKVDIVEGGRDGSSIAFHLVYGYKNNPNYDTSFRDSKLTKVKTYTTSNSLTVNKFSRNQTSEPEGMDIPKGASEFVYDITSNDKSIEIVHDVLPGETEQTQHIEDAIATLKFL